MRGQTRTVPRRAAARAPPSPSASDSSSASPARPAKRRKTASSSTSSKTAAYRNLLLLLQQSPAAAPPPSLPPLRRHPLAYHRPLLLDDAARRAALLAWFDSVSAARAMPWRKPWVNPADFSSPASLRKTLEQRAYQVWISEIMLQQTRVAVVIDYWNRWMEQWPTVHDLAAASADDVLAAWRGLGYYSRATRIHEAARLVVGDASMRGLLPSSAHDLADKIPGVGRYTAGAISCIAFGCPAPMVDGNVLRVLSRQLGLHGDTKTDRVVIDMIWAAAEALVNAVALDAQTGKTAPPEDTRSDGPGRWGQALMELGSTVCTPKPSCGACPVTATCRAYSEGLALSSKPSKDHNTEATIADMEDLCTVCEPLIDTDDVQDQPPAAPPKGGKQATLSSFFTKSAPAKTAAAKVAGKVDIEAIIHHARKFPVKATKKPVREEQTLVCAILRPDGRYLIHKRPARGLLAGLWEFPSLLLKDADSASTTASQRKKLARDFVSDVLDAAQARHIAELGSVPWLFSHIKLTMHVHLFKLEGGGDGGRGETANARWSDEVGAESMGTGMRKCWDLVKEAA